MITPAPGWTIFDWRHAITSGTLTKEAYLSYVGQFSDSDPAWIHRATSDAVGSQLDALSHRLGSARNDPNFLPLFGVPFAVKDNIDVAGMPTTAACPAFSYVPSEDATVVRLLKDQGAIVVGKSNLDQFATGLVGTRSPYGIPRSPFDAKFIAGGSSSGSASLVSRGLVPFALGTDTAGSGRVPAAFGNIVGLKPTRGTFSTKGLVPACRTLDCASVFSLTVDDAALAGSILRHFDPLDCYSRPFVAQAPRDASLAPRVGILRPLEFFGDNLASRAFSDSCQRLGAAGWNFVSVDAEPFAALAELLYGGAWIAERSLTAGPLLDRPELMDPTVHAILLPARTLSAEDAYRSEYQRARWAAVIAHALDGLDALLVPTTGTTYRVEEVEASPLETNARLGRYTNFTNLADLSAVAVPGRFRSDGVPAGLTLLGPAFADDRLLDLARTAHEVMELGLGATPKQLSEARAVGSTKVAAPARKSDHVRLVVVGAHLSSMPLNHELTDLGAQWVRTTQTSTHYRLFLLEGGAPQKPGLQRCATSAEGQEIQVEVWELPLTGFAKFVENVPPPLGIGSVELSDGSWEKGFICEAFALENALDITQYGGFVAYINERNRNS